MPNTTILANGNNYNKSILNVYSPQNTYMGLHIMYMHPHPPKVFIQAWKKYTNGKMENIGVQMEKEMSIQNTEKKINEGICGIRTTGNT